LAPARPSEGGPAEPPLPSAPASEGTAVAPSPAGATNDDPEQNARAFVERNRKEAQEELKKLKEEAQRLRTRLGKVEAGILRWEALLSALDDSERIGPPVTARRAQTDEPTQLEPVPAARSALPES
jgi:hypothetical protein